YGQGNRLKNVAMSCPAPVHRAASPSCFFQIEHGVTSTSFQSARILAFPMGFPAPLLFRPRQLIPGSKGRNLLLPLLCPGSYRSLPIVTPTQEGEKTVVSIKHCTATGGS